ncbi:unnamed protein product [Aphanomyces euteiches]|uniref:AB hydrolase-1 domain-containing protein n=1 Tax=Aphanomyces euteiches TaxID=100861 RepID=A0A6G0XCL7_9STRA|nr:hypothetical protein Ae201684_005949 [Aphanomyces euteiches]KAH9068729.1 hypothetical protein Ae201684P_004430 [Aphanomyces euteiches]KAH9137581.1 hypothetical protein AeRB84_017783 [Aphanomyces euteiches]
MAAAKVLDKMTLSNGHNLWFAMYGAADALKTYILIHGSPGNHKGFKHLSPLLVHNVNVISLDLPGSGLTSPAAAGGIKLTEERIVEATSDFVRTLASQNPRRQFILVGHSFGGATAMQVAARGQLESLKGL